MFRSILDFHEHSPDFRRVGQKHNFIHNENRFILYKPCNNYFGKGNKAIDDYNQKRFEMENDANFQRAKNKIKLVIYKNGFILNNGPFRDRSLLENNEFLESVEKGNIPQELLNKGINDLGILLINRKTEIYSNSPLYQSLPISVNYLNLSKTKTKFSHPLDLFFLNKGKTENMNTSYTAGAISRNENSRPLYSIKTERVHNIKRNPKRKKTVPLDNFIKVIDLIEGKEKEKKYEPFSGKGQLLADSYIEVPKENEVKNFTSNSSPSCIISLRLFTGEIIKVSFNYNQTLKEVYYYAKKVSGINDFALLDGFPPKSLLDLDMTIRELNLENSVLTQKI